MLKVAIVAAVLSFATNASAESTDLSAINDVLARFDGKALPSPEQVFDIEPGRLIGVSRVQKTIKSVVTTDRRISFHVVSVRTQTNFRLDEQGNRILPGETVDNVSVKQCMLTKRRSAERIYGICFSEMESGYETTAEITVEADGTVVVDERSAAPFDDGYTASTASGWKPALMGYKSEYTAGAAELVLATTETGFDYDTATNSAASTPYATIRREYRLRN